MTLRQALLRRGVRHRASPDGRLHLNCCFCGDAKLKLCVHTKLGWGRCMKCGWKRRHAVAAVLERLGITEQIEGNAARVEEIEKVPPPELPKDFTVLTHVWDDLDFQARAYLIKRGVTHAQIRDNRIGISYAGRYAYRIIFPVWRGDELKGINARAFMNNKEPKYLNSPGEKWLYNFNPLKKTTVLSEGVFKCLRIAQACGHGSAALLGHDLTDVQLGQIVGSKCERIILYPDADAVGKRGVVKIADKLSEGWKGEVLLAHPVTTPADDAPLADVKGLLLDPLPYSWSTRQKMLL